MKLESYWLDTAPEVEGLQAGPPEGQADVAVIGAGFTGLSAARALARYGADVVVLEAGRTVGEASGTNGGHCNTGLVQDYFEVVRHFGEEQANTYYQTFSAAVDTVERVVREERIACDFVRNCKLKIAVKPEHYDKLARTYEALKNGVDPNVELIGPEKIADEIDSQCFHGGLLQSTSAQLHVGRFGVGLAQAAIRCGVRLFESAPVEQVKRRPDGRFEVKTNRGSVSVNKVLVATGCTVQGGPFGWFRRRIVPVGSFMVATEELPPEVMDKLLPQRRNYVTTKNIGNYFRATPDNRLLFGGRARFAMSGKSSDQKSGAILRHMLAEMFPQLADVRLDYCWGGLVDMTQDRFPRAGEHRGMYYSLGYSGHGVQMAVHMGRIMADVINGRLERNPWSGLKWRAIPGHFGHPWFLPFVGAYFRVKDRLS
jgi:glycine/D-amino acid oxidase-like deaminating enzyme